MPVGQPPGQHHQHSSLFSSLGSFLHVLQSSNHDSDASAPSLSSTAPSASLSAHGTSLEAYEAFEADLAERLSLLLPVGCEPCVNLAALKQAMDVVLATQAGLKGLASQHLQQHHALPRHDKVLEEFMERSVRMLDVCRVIKDQVQEVEGLKGWLETVIRVMIPECLTRGRVRRARKGLTELLNMFTYVDNKDADFHYDLHSHRHISIHNVQSHYRSHRRSSSKTGDELQEHLRWMSWRVTPLVRRLSSGRASDRFYSERQLAAVAASLSAPKHSSIDEDESFSAAVYSFNVVCIFFLSTVLSSLPCPDHRNHVLCFSHPRFFAWASALTRLQERVQEELRKRLRKGGYVGLYELDEIACIAKQLFQVTESIMSADEFPPAECMREEVTTLMNRLRQHVEELDVDLQPFYLRVCQLHNNFVETRMELLDVMSSTGQV